MEFWGPGWDWQRRLTLLRHYRAYWRHPPIPAQFQPASLTSELTGAERAFSAAYLERIVAVQLQASRTSGVHLTFRPIGKNLRLLGTAIRVGTDRGRRVAIRQGGPPDEVRMLAARGHSWSPWLWARTGAADSGAPEHAGHAWNALFANPPADPAPLPVVGPLPAIARLGDRREPFTRGHLESVLKVAVATRYVFAPHSDTMASVEELKRAAGWPTGGELILGMHVRRGDAAAADPEPLKATRRSFSLETYLEQADALCERYGIRHVFLATESRDELERAVSLRPQYRFLWLDYDRSLLPDIRTSRQFIEDLALDHPEKARAIAITGIYDLCCLCECHAFVGAFNSEFSVLSWLLTIGARGHLVPYVSLSQPASTRHLHPFSALLNKQNNCPLELYHW
jgi:hypothetical protein